jgi:hypothetical protein
MFQKKKDETASPASAKSHHSQFKVVSKRESAILPETGHPSGWVNRASDISGSAGEGKEWRSKA